MVKSIVKKKVFNDGLCGSTVPPSPEIQFAEWQTENLGEIEVVSIQKFNGPDMAQGDTLVVWYRKIELKT